ncbi:phosphatase PAP2 family protein [Pandoraea sp.]|uniref:phosphatase PAP2 family protein n=1 Tax=Pandoraea sp. TaxID=1883445 RepID=UPI00121CBAEF|nr:phosphatase PAP2 family protein [Pandoraea sp.]TAL52677.1 MAG: phosphatase PAP2 family protein [Pandoraea sp.]TAM16320.1 MAG: phosphatase PAP2 family protein [Pandoraea sp.]
MLAPSHWMMLTNLADSAVLAPAALAIAIWLGASRAWRLATLWCALFGVGVVMVAATKIAFIGWGLGVRSLNFTGISGHTMLATAVYPTILWLVLQRYRPAVRNTGAALGLLFGVVVGLSRLVLHAHSPSEVVAGCLWGAVVSIGFIALSQLRSLPALHPLMFVCSLLLIGAVLYGTRAPSQRLIIRTALALSGHHEPYIRVTWRMRGTGRNQPAHAAPVCRDGLSGT